MSVAELVACLDGRRWRQLNDHVVCAHNGPLTRRQQFWAVLLSAQGYAALCGLTVLELHEVRGFATPVVHIVVRRGARVLPVPGVVVKVHESRRFERGDRREFHDLSVTDVSRATIDAAVWTRDARQAWRIVVAAVQQRRTRPELLGAELAKAGQVRHRRTLRLLLNDMIGGAEALSEVEFLRFCRRHKLPVPKVQVRLDTAGRRRYLDAAFTRADGSRFGVEIDGGVHLRMDVRVRDTLKDNDAKLAHRLVLRYESVLIYTDDPDALRQLRSALCLPDPPAA